MTRSYLYTPSRCRAALCFFFQAEDGIRDHCVTGVQTCALPISTWQTGKSACGRDGPALGGVLPGRPRLARRRQIGRASCRERVEISEVAVSIKKKRNT